MKTERRRKYRKARAKRRQRGRRYRRSSGFRRLKRMRKRFKKRIAAARKARGKRVRVFVASNDVTGAEVVERVLSGRPVGEQEDDIPAEASSDEGVDADIEALRDDPDAAVQAVAHAYALVGELAAELASRLREDAEDAGSEEEREAAEEALASVEEIQDEADAVVDVAGDPEEDEEGGGDESAPPESGRAPGAMQPGELPGVGWIRRR